MTEKKAVNGRDISSAGTCRASDRTGHISISVLSGKLRGGVSATFALYSEGATFGDFAKRLARSYASENRLA